MGIKVTTINIMSVYCGLMRLLFVITGILPLLFIPNISSANGQEMVVFPVYHNDADRVITEILDGIHDRLGDITEVPVDTTLDNSVIQKRFASLTDQDVVIALTSDMGALVRSSGFKGQLIEGVSGSSANVPPITRVGIQPSPGVYLRSLKKIHPGIARVLYFYSDSTEDADLDNLRSASKILAIELQLIPVDNIGDGMKKLGDAIDHSNATTDAIWIPYHLLSAANNTMLKFVLSESWKRSLIVYTDSLDAVVRGLLFTLVPDYRAYGSFLGKYAEESKGRSDTPGSDTVRYFDDGYLMVNQRFAVHIGLNINRSIFDKLKIVVPAK